MTFSAVDLIIESPADIVAGGSYAGPWVGPWNGEIELDIKFATANINNVLIGVQERVPFETVMNAPQMENADNFAGNEFTQQYRFMIASKEIRITIRASATDPLIGISYKFVAMSGYGTA